MLGKTILPLCFRRKPVRVNLVPRASLVGSLELSNAKKGNLLEFVCSVTDGNYVLLFLMSWVLLEEGLFSVMYLSKPGKARVCTSENSLLEISQQNCSWYRAIFDWYFFSWKCLLSVENSGGYLKISAEISVNHVQFCRPELENLCEEYLKPAVVVSTGEDSTFFMR